MNGSQRLEEPVTYKALLSLLGAFAVFQLGAVATGVSRSENTVSRATAETAASIQQLQAKVDRHKDEQDAGRAELSKDIQAVYQFLVTRQRQSRLEKP